MESFDLYAFTSNLNYFEIIILLFFALFASIVSGISGYGGGMTLGILVSPFVPVKLLVPLISVFVFCSNLSRMYYYRDSIFWTKGLYVALISSPFAILGTSFYAGVSDRVLYFCLGFGLALIIIVGRIFKKINLKISWFGLGVMAICYGTISGVILGPGALILTALSANGMVGAGIIGTDSLITVINSIIRLVSFRKLGLLNNDALAIGCSIGVVAIFGSYIARKIVDKLGVKLHTFIIEICVILGAIVMIYRAFAS